MKASEEVVMLQQTRRRLWSDKEWLKTPPPKKDQIRRGEIRRSGSVSYASRTHGEIG